ncbi:uncharacterized protein LOC659764 [Tribolium castaneum]
MLNLGNNEKMPSHKPTKTYPKRRRSQHSESAKVFNALLAENLTKRLKSRKKKATLELRDLPPRVQEYITEESLHVSPNDTFDKLLKGKVYNEVKTVASFVKIQSSESEASTHVKLSVHSPVIRRRKRPKVVVAELPEPPLPKRNSTPVTSSLSIEKENNKKDYPSLSYIKLPQIRENEVSHNNLRIFSDTFRERNTVHSSTPCVTAPVRRIVGDPISPITTSGSSKLWKESIEEIQKWDKEFPKLETSKGAFLRSKLKTDWKLTCQPKVYLKKTDIITRSKSKRNDFKGFSQEEQTTWSRTASLTKSSVRELDKELSDLSQRQPHVSTPIRTTRSSSLKKNAQPTTSPLPLRRISTRKRKLTNVSEKSAPISPKKTRSSTRLKPEREKPRTTRLKKSRRISKRISEKSHENSHPKPVKKLQIVTPPKNRSLSPEARTSEASSKTKRERVVSSRTRSKFKIDTSFDFSLNKVASPKKSNLTANLIAFDDFTRSHFSSIQVPESSIVISDDSFNTEASINILSETCQKVLHDHSYSNSSAKLSDVIESSLVDFPLPGTSKNVAVRKKPKPIQIKPGKLYRRTLSLMRRESVVVPEAVLDVWQSGSKCLRRRSIFLSLGKKSHGDTILESYARSSVGYVQQEEKYINDLDDSVRSLSLDSRGSLSPNLQIVTAKDVVLRRCGQTDVLPFEQCYPQSALQHCQKIGEGVYGEVFLYRNPKGGTSVMKVIPIEGDLIVNGEKQKKFEEILSEIVIAMELSNLRNNEKNTTTSFSQVQNVKCVQGVYPERLLDLWELYDETKGSENDSPQMFPPHQQYIVLELANGGDDLESYVFNNAQQAYAVFQQIACALAVAEAQLKFEHRDLHWGNVLINTVNKSKVLPFRLNGKEILVETNGVEATIIDFTLSRVEFDGVAIFYDLSLDDELFHAKGDYQFEIYRLMQKANGNMWQHFEPFSNILWLHYILDKAVTSAVRYKNPKSKIHLKYMAKLKKIKDEILAFRSVAEFVAESF